MSSVPAFPLRQTLDQLLNLQKIDSQRDKLAREQNKLDYGAASAVGAAAARAEAVAAHARLSRLQGALKDAELELSSVESKTKSYQQRMSSGQFTTAREIANVEKELGQLSRQRSALDDKILTTMEQLEATQTEAAGLDARSSQAEQDLSTRKQADRAQSDRLTAELRALVTVRSSLVGEIGDAALLKRYDALREKPSNAGVAIARIEEMHCGGCHNQVSLQHAEKVREGAQVVTCENCGRLLA